MKVEEAQVSMSKDEAILVEISGEIDTLKEEQSFTEDFNVRKRGRLEDKNQGFGESVVKIGGSERRMVTCVRRGRVKREKGQEGLDMNENRYDVSSSSYAECSRGEKLELGDNVAEKEEGNDSEKERSKVEGEGWCLGVRQARVKAMEKITTVLNVTDDGLSNRGKKKGIHRKMNNNGTSLEDNEVGAEIAQMEDEKTKPRRSMRCKGKGKGEGEELNESVAKTRVGRKMDDNVG